MIYNTTHVGKLVLCMHMYVCVCLYLCLMCICQALDFSLWHFPLLFPRVKKFNLHSAHLLRATDGASEWGCSSAALHPLRFFSCAQATRCLRLLTPKTASKSDLMRKSSWWINLGLCLTCGEHAEMGIFTRLFPNTAVTVLTSLLVLFTTCTSGYPAQPHPTGYQGKS